ncbi:MAG: hypothetical protein JXR86_11800 [Spirochaetales bacterium]|nr:hypothetical protein [Spirochaetales bacterium]
MSLFFLPLFSQSASNDSALKELSEKLFPGSGEEAAALREAFQAVPREKFLDGTYKNLAYRDAPLPAGGGLIHPAPSLIAAILNEASISPYTRVCIIGRNTAYISRIISRLTDNLFVSDPDPSADPGDSSYQWKKDLSYYGWIEDSPFDLIILFGALNEIPQSLITQLSINGRIIAPLESNTGNQILISAIKYNDSFTLKSICSSYIHQLQ